MAATTCLAAAGSARAAELQPREATVRSGDLDLSILRVGAGKVILFLHGHPDNAWLYIDQLREFGRDHLAVSLDLRGYAPSASPRDVAAYAMRHSLADLHAVLDALSARSCVLVGNDWGGYIAWVFASTYPGRVDRLVVLNAPHPFIHLREVTTSAEQNRASQYERELNAAVWPYPLWYNYYKADPIKVPVSPGRLVMSPEELHGRLLEGVGDGVNNGLKVTVPTLVIWGMQDPALLAGQLEGMERYAPDLRIVRVPDAGHYPMRTHARVVNEEIRGFLAPRR